MNQLLNHSKAWLLGNVLPSDLNIEDIVSGSINAWQERFTLHVNQSPYENEIEELRRVKADIHSGQADVFARWQGEKSRNFDDWFIEECSGYGKGLLQVFENYFLRMTKVLSGQDEMNMNDVFPPAFTIISAMRKQFEKEGVPKERSLIAVEDFLSSPPIHNVPFIKITALMYAAIAYRAAKTGKKKQPGPGMWIDINSISLLLPYCDTIFVDNECRSLLQEPQVKEKMDYETKVFSRSNRHEFMIYLDEIESSATKEHLEVVREVYGDDWPTPNTTMYHDKSTD